jgi:hypothetical protein
MCARTGQVPVSDVLSAQVGVLEDVQIVPPSQGDVPRLERYLGRPRPHAARMIMGTVQRRVFSARHAGLWSGGMGCE